MSGLNVVPCRVTGGRCSDHWPAGGSTVEFAETTERQEGRRKERGKRNEENEYENGNQHILSSSSSLCDLCDLCGSLPLDMIVESIGDVRGIAGGAEDCTPGVGRLTDQILWHRCRVEGPESLDE